MPGGYWTAAVVKAKEDKIDHSEPAHMDEEYEFLLKKQDQGITFREYCRRLGINL
jgi:hypothetical protein